MYNNNIPTPQKKKQQYYQFFLSIKQMFCVRKRYVSLRRGFLHTQVFIEYKKKSPYIHIGPTLQIQCVQDLLFKEVSISEIWSLKFWGFTRPLL